MRERGPEELLWELPRAESGDDAPAPPDDALLAYRAGTLATPEEIHTEWGLAGSRQGRARLAELAGIRLDAPAPRRSMRRRFVAAAFAAAAAAAFVAVLVLNRGEPVALPDFAVRAEGLATTRGAPGDARALPDGRVRIVVEPTGDAIPGLGFAAYRLDRSELTRLAEPAEVAVEVDRGSAVLTATAERLVGSSLGTRPFFVVVTDRARLPGRVVLKDEDPESALARASGGKVYRVPLKIVDATDGAP